MNAIQNVVVIALGVMVMSGGTFEATAKPPRDMWFELLTEKNENVGYYREVSHMKNWRDSSNKRHSYTLRHSYMMFWGKDAEGKVVWTSVLSKEIYRIDPRTEAMIPERGSYMRVVGDKKTKAAFVVNTATRSVEASLKVGDEKEQKRRMPYVPGSRFQLFLWDGFGDVPLKKNQSKTVKVLRANDDIAKFGVAELTMRRTAFNIEIYGKNGGQQQQVEVYQDIFAADTPNRKRWTGLPMHAKYVKDIRFIPAQYRDHLKVNESLPGQPVVIR
ncbi:MAG: hypothetical protein ACPGVU_07275 [Limisphaerales bacterium]